ncbi:MAG: multifunctional CCA addition/repair protein [Gammaproteobacteria bacterium]|nr:MAG: multifunctional CCA addition/repair protein [Gammaproteobacteria bacterium]
MKIYQVGGSIRDELLGLPVKERDWVVVGGSRQLLLEQGYQQVGKDFPVFIHPETGEEYALARTERKVSAGYHGFEFDESGSVSLKEDLRRRDLTINTLARDSEGRILDFFGARRDLQNRVLRHVSPAFAEDPVRVLRLARFAARFHHLGFTIAPETLELVRTMSASGELSSLVPERIWKELYKSLLTLDPSRFIQCLRDGQALKVIFPEIERLFGVPQPEKYHPEIDTGIHVMMAMDRARRISEAPEVVFAAMMHDLGKGLTPASIWPHHRGHEKRGVEPVSKLCKRLRVPNDFRELALLVTEHHTKLYRIAEMRSSTIVKLLLKLDAFRRRQRFNQFLEACQADVQGRLGKENEPFEYGRLWQGCVEAAEEVDIDRITTDKALSGQEIGEAIFRQRCDAVDLYRSHSFPSSF